MFNMRLELQKRRLTSTLFFSAIIPASLITVCIFLYSIHVIDKEYKKISEYEIHTIANEYKNQINKRIENTLSHIKIFSSLHVNNLYSPKDLLSAFTILNTTMEWLDGIVVMTENGELLAEAGHPHSLNLGAIASSHAASAPSMNAVISDVQAPENGIPHFSISTRVRIGDKTHIACLSVNAFIFSAILDKVRVGRTGEAFLINSQGILQTRSVLHGSILDSVDKPLADSTPQTDAIQQRPWQDTRIWYTVLPLESIPGWRLVVQRDEREILQSRDTQLARFILLGLLCLTALIAIAWRTIKKTRVLQDQMEEERARLTDCDIQVQKLDAISQLGVGIAHEVNNPLAIIGEEVGWMQDVLKRESFTDHPDAGELRESLRQIVAQTARSREITHKLLSFGGKTDGIIRDVEINTLVTDVVTLRRREASQKNIEIKAELGARLPVILSEPALLRQLLINLINNAMDAMPEGGLISVTTRRDDSGGVVLQVEDTGFGIPEENLSKIFDPFFTTKAPGKGAGLGLSISHGILRRIGGQISATSRPGHGSTFTVQLPLEARSTAS
jgi:two-component system, NtrC family, sensor kinase